MMKHRLFPWLAAVAGGGLMISAQVLASDPTASQPATTSLSYFTTFDTNHDGMLSRSEVSEGLVDLRAHFDRFDFNGDHRLNQREYANYWKTLQPDYCAGAKNDKCSRGYAYNSPLPSSFSEPSPRTTFPMPSPGSAH